MTDRKIFSKISTMAAPITAKATKRMTIRSPKVAPNNTTRGRVASKEKNLSEVVISRLTESHRVFIKAMAAGENLTGASKKAGFTVQNAYHLMKQEHIVNAIRTEQNKYERVVNMTRKRVMDGFLEAIEMARLQASPADMIGGWREIAKMCGYYEPKKVQIDVVHQGVVQLKALAQLSDGDLLKMIEEGRVIDGEAELIQDSGDDSDASEE